MIWVQSHVMEKENGSCKKFSDLHTRLWQGSFPFLDKHTHVTWPWETNEWVLKTAAEWPSELKMTDIEREGKGRKGGKKRKGKPASCVGVGSPKCNPNYSGGWDGVMMNLRSACGNRERTFVNQIPVGLKFEASGESYSLTAAFPCVPALTATGKYPVKGVYWGICNRLPGYWSQYQDSRKEILDPRWDAARFISIGHLSPPPSSQLILKSLQL